MKQKKLLAILGSPHEHGSTAAMLACAVDAAERAGWETETISLYKKQIAFCTGCCACCKSGCCIIKDDIQEITASLKACDTVVLAAPTYWANVPAAVKNLFDRLFGTAIEETSTFPKPRLPGPRYLLLTACNTPAPFAWMFGQSRGTLRAMDEFFKTSGMKRLGSVTFAGAKGRPALPAAVREKIRGYWP